MSRTISIVINGAFAGTSKTGNPFSSRMFTAGASARLARPERTFPIVVPAEAARLAAAR